MSKKKAIKIIGDGKNPVELRDHAGELRTIEDQGIVSAYLTKWGTVDSYGTTFTKGSFKKTFQERGTKIKLLFNHDPLAGKVIAVGEDDIGPWVRCQFNLDTKVGFDSFAHVKAKDVDAFSFGFNRMKSKPANKENVIEITEVRVMECGPVIFPANEEAAITDVRSEDFNETMANRELTQRGYKLFSALDWTMDDIKWSDNSSEGVISKTDTAIAEFHTQYISWLNEYFAAYERSEEAITELRNNSFKGNKIQQEMRNQDKEKLMKSTSLTEEDINLLSNGELLATESRSKLDELPEAIREAHQVRRNEVVKTLCDELRNSGFSKLEALRFTSLLGLPEVKTEKEPKRNGDILAAIDSWKL